MNILPTDYISLINVKSTTDELNDIIDLYKRIRGIKPMNYKTDMDSYHEYLKRLNLYIEEIVRDAPIAVDTNHRGQIRNYCKDIELTTVYTTTEPTMIQSENTEIVGLFTNLIHYHYHFPCLKIKSPLVKVCLDEVDKSIEFMVEEFLSKHSHREDVIKNKFHLNLIIKHLKKIFSTKLMYFSQMVNSPIFLVPLYNTPLIIIYNTVNIIVDDFFSRTNKYLNEAVEKLILSMIDPRLIPKQNKVETNNDKKCAIEVPYLDNLDQEKIALIQSTTDYIHDRYFKLSMCLNGKYFHIKDEDETVFPPSANNKCKFTNCFISFGSDRTITKNYIDEPTQLYVDCKIDYYLSILRSWIDISRSVMFLNCVLTSDRSEDEQYKTPISSFEINDIFKTYISIPIFSSTDRIVHVFMNIHGHLVYSAGCFFGEEKEFLSEITDKYSDQEEILENYLSVIEHAKKTMRRALPISNRHMSLIV